LNAYLSRLDTCLPAIQDGWMLLDKNIPYDRMIMGILWASSRGIPLILDPLNKEDLLKPGFKMDFGLFYFGNFIETDDQGKYNLLFETVHFADKNGFTAVWTPERHFNEFGGLYPNPSVLSAALAVATTAVQIRSGSLVVPLHHPVRVAEDWALVDNLSKGRVAISFASGWQCDDFIFYPEHYADRHACMLNQIDIIKRLWRGENVAFRNGLGKEIDISVYPKPLQKELPVWITVSARIETFIDAGKIGANILTHLLWQNTDELIEKIAAYRRSLQENGFDPRSKIVSVMVHTFLGHHNDTVKEKVRAPLKHYIKSSTQLIQSMIRSNSQQNNSKEVGGRYGSVEGEVPGHLLDELAEIAFNRFFDQAALLGTIEKAKKLIEKLRSYDVDEVACLIDFGIHKKDIMEGLTYLNELRKQYESNNFSKYPVKIIHCQPDKLHYCTTNKSFANINAILAEAKSFEDIPEPWVHKTKIIYDPSSSQTTWEVRIEENNVSINNADALFSETINEEF
jgi:natural product biosynthesis luciferase-like monooxygenase protein